MDPVAALPKGRSGRFSRALFRAFAFSFVIHITLFGASLIPRINLFQRSDLKKLLEKKPSSDRAIPLEFVEVKTEKPSAEAPKDAKFYGAVNMQPANPLPENKPAPEPLKPSVAPPVPKAQPKPVEKKTDLAMARESAPKKKEEPKKQVESPKAAPREEVKPDPAVKRHDLVASPGVQGSLSGLYDQRFVETVETRWYQLLDQVSSKKAGKVVLDFQISYDGRISELIVRETTVDEMQTMLCKKAILDPAPYPRWSTDLRKEFKRDARDVTFTFHYRE